MSSTSKVMDSLRTVLMLVLLFFISLINGLVDIALILGFFYAFWYYYRKSKRLQAQLNQTPGSNAGFVSSSESGDMPPPPSTDA